MKAMLEVIGIIPRRSIINEFHLQVIGKDQSQSLVSIWFVNRLTKETVIDAVLRGRRDRDRRKVRGGRESAQRGGGGAGRRERERE